LRQPQSIVAEPPPSPDSRETISGSGAKAAALGARVAAGAVAVIVAAALTLAAVVAVVAWTTAAISISSLPLRILAVAADVVGATVLLLVCIYLTTRIAVAMVGVGNTEFPPIPEHPPDEEGKK